MRTDHAASTDGKVDVPALAARFAACFPQPDAAGRRVAVALYRLLARGEPVAPEEIAAAGGVETGRVEGLLEEWPGVFREAGRVIGFWGLTARPLSSHRFLVNGRTLYTWCAWDALFLPAILGAEAGVTSRDPQSGEPIRLTVAPDGVAAAEPAATVVSMLEPREDMVEDIVARLCHYIHFFASPASGREWVAAHPGTLLLSLEEAFELGRLKNEARFGEALAPAPG